MKVKSLFLVVTGVLTVAVFSNFSSKENISLHEVYSHYFPIGAAINPELDLVDEDRKRFISRQYNSITPENQMKAKFIHPAENKYSWEKADGIVAFGREHKMKIRGHALVWYQSTPEWMVKDGEQDASRDLLYKRMEDHINALVGRYKNDVYCWDVVNEAISDKPGEIFRNTDALYRICGEEYVEKAFVLARKADPRAQLYYNDYRFSNPAKRQKIYNLLKSLVDKKVPIDGVGLQSHYVPGEITEEYLQETIDMFSKLGLKVQITELDVSVYNYRDKSGAGGTVAGDDTYTAEREKVQADMYEMLFRVYRKNRDVITGVTFWGTSDARNNYRTRKIGKMDYPFLFDEFMQPKKAFYAVTKF